MSSSSFKLCNSSLNHINSTSWPRCWSSLTCLRAATNYKKRKSSGEPAEVGAVCPCWAVHPNSILARVVSSPLEDSVMLQGPHDLQELRWCSNEQPLPKLGLHVIQEAWSFFHWEACFLSLPYVPTEGQCRILFQENLGFFTQHPVPPCVSGSDGRIGGGTCTSPSLADLGLERVPSPPTKLIPTSVCRTLVYGSWWPRQDRP